MMENNQSMSVDRNFFRERSWNDTNSYGNMQDLGDYSAGNSVWRSGTSLSQDNGQPVEELYKELTDFIPMVQSFMDIRSHRAYNHQAPVIYTPRPPRDSSSEKTGRYFGGPKSRVDSFHRKKLEKSPEEICFGEFVRQFQESSTLTNYAESACFPG